MLAYHFCDRPIKMTERSDSTNQQSSIINSQSGSGFAGLGLCFAIFLKQVLSFLMMAQSLGL
jgi:hypothetical protein